MDPYDVPEPKTLKESLKPAEPRRVGPTLAPSPDILEQARRAVAEKEALLRDPTAPPPPPRAVQPAPVPTPPAVDPTFTDPAPDLSWLDDEDAGAQADSGRESPVPETFPAAEAPELPGRVVAEAPEAPAPEEPAAPTFFFDAEDLADSELAADLESEAPFDGGGDFDDWSEELDYRPRSDRTLVLGMVGFAVAIVLVAACAGGVYSILGASTGSAESVVATEPGPRTEPAPPSELRQAPPVAPEPVAEPLVPEPEPPAPAERVEPEEADPAPLATRPGPVSRPRPVTRPRPAPARPRPAPRPRPRPARPAPAPQPAPQPSSASPWGDISPAPTPAPAPAPSPSSSPWDTPE